jgi:plasmid maintenance system killer protein
MEVSFANHRLQALYANPKKTLAEHGSRVGRVILVRLQQLCDVQCLMDMKAFPDARLHMLTGGTYHGTYSINVSQRLRLLFIPDHDPVPVLPAGNHDLTKITAVVIQGIEDTHE